MGISVQPRLSPISQTFCWLPRQLQSQRMQAGPGLQNRSRCCCCLLQLLPPWRMGPQMKYQQKSTSCLL